MLKTRRRVSDRGNCWLDVECRRDQKAFGEAEAADQHLVWAHFARCIEICWNERVRSSYIPL